MEYVGAAVGLGVLLAMIGWFLWRWTHHAGREIQVGRARELFALQRDHLQSLFFKAAAATGKPKGLRWKNCEFGSELQLARDKKSGELLGLLPVTIAFEAIPGSDMEGLPAVGNLRSASAVFVFHRRNWTMTGRAVFNLNPDEAIRHFHNAYDPVQKE